MIYVEFDPETDEPRIVRGKYAIHENSNVLKEFNTLKEAQETADKLNSEKNLVFVEGYFNMSFKEATIWINNHTQEDIDTIFDECTEDNPPLMSYDLPAEF